MFDATSLSDVAGLPASGAGQDTPTTQPASIDRLRVRGGVEIELAARDGRTVLARQRERDGYKLRTPRRADALEIAIINTGGGVAGGDRVAVDIMAGPDADAVVATPAAERIYRAATDAAARYDVSLTLADGCEIAWLPQETIVFDRARLKRSITAHLASTARLVMIETVVFGRLARSETLTNALFHDDWRIRRDGRLVFADSVRLSGDVDQQLASPFVAGGHRVLTTILVAAPEAEDRLETVRAALARMNHDLRGDIAASAFDGVLLVRALTPQSHLARRIVETLVPVLCRGPVPRVWSC